MLGDEEFGGRSERGKRDLSGISDRTTTGDRVSPPGGRSRGDDAASA